MYPIPPNEKLVEMKHCKKCSIEFPITDKDIEFYEKVSPVFGGKKYHIPTPTLCPECRQQRRISFYNTRSIYKRLCNATGQNIISIYAPSTQYIVYERKEWLSDRWNPLEYGVDFDFSKSFFEQFFKLQIRVPRRNLNNDEQCENSPYVNCVTNCKDSYLIFDSVNANSCLYGGRYMYSENCMDCFNSMRSTECYECHDISNCHSCLYSGNCNDCSQSSFLYGCSGCSHCLFCVNLYNKEYYIFNTQYSKEDYEERVEKIFRENGYVKMKEMLIDFYKKQPRKNLNVKTSENTIGDRVNGSQHATSVFDASSLQDVKYAQLVLDTNTTYDVNNVCCNTDFSYEICAGGINMFSCLFSKDVWPSVSNTLYSESCYTSSHLFACIGLRNAEYCILNKQYSKEEYEELVPQIISHMMKTGEWGEFFPSSISLFGYNETVAQEYFPLSKEQAISQGFNWSDYEAPFPKVEKIIPASKLPENIGDIPDDILNWAIECEITNKPFRIIKQELEFYRKHGIPIPRRHPDIRYEDRMKLRNPRRLWERKCDKCSKDILSTYSTDRTETVYCEGCYEREILG